MNRTERIFRAVQALTVFIVGAVQGVPMDETVRAYVVIAAMGVGVVIQAYIAEPTVINHDNLGGDGSRASRTEVDA